MPQRRTCRQSTVTVVGMISGNWIEAGETPSSSAFTTCPACAPMASKLATRPPTTPVPRNVLNGPYTGALAAVATISADSLGVMLRPLPSWK